MGGSYKLGYYSAWGRGGRNEQCEREERAGAGAGGRRARVGVPPLRHPRPGTPLQEGVPAQTTAPAPIIIITLQGEPGACNPTGGLIQSAPPPGPDRYSQHNITGSKHFYCN